jgi:hypothetical protein
VREPSIANVSRNISGKGHSGLNDMERHGEELRDEAIQTPLDCLAPLAMTRAGLACLELDQRHFRHGAAARGRIVPARTRRLAPWS